MKQNIKPVLLYKNNFYSPARFIFIIILLLMISFAQGVEAVTRIKSASPGLLNLTEKRPGYIHLRGVELNKLTLIELCSDKACRKKEMSAKVRYIGSARAGKIQININNKVPAGIYYLVAGDGKKTKIPVATKIQVKKIKSKNKAVKNNSTNKTGIATNSVNSSTVTSISSALPANVELTARRPAYIALKGKSLIKIRNIMLCKDRACRQNEQTIKARYSGNSNSGKIQLRGSVNTPPGKYYIVVTDSSKKTMPVPAIVEVKGTQQVASQSPVVSRRNTSQSKNTVNQARNNNVARLTENKKLNKNTINSSKKSITNSGKLVSKRSSAINNVVNNVKNNSSRLNTTSPVVLNTVATRRKMEDCLTEKPLVPVPGGPRNNEVVDAATPSVAWSPANCATGYKVWFGAVTGAGSHDNVKEYETTNTGLASFIGEIYQDPDLRQKYVGKKVSWKVRALNTLSTDPAIYYGDWSQIKNFIVPLGNPAMTLPAHNVEGSSNPVRFEWNGIIGATSYEVMYKRTGETGWRRQAVNQSFGSTNIELPVNGTFHWYVKACSEIDGDKICTPNRAKYDVRDREFYAYTHQGTGAVEIPETPENRVTFEEHLKPVFEHPKCVRCHSVVNEEYVIDSDSLGLPATHPTMTPGGLAVNATMNASSDDNNNCMTCHSRRLDSNLGSIRPSWHASPRSMDFTSDGLCEKARSVPASANSAEHHLKQDVLILWAISQGALGNETGTAAIESWRNLVDDWVASGKPCN